MQCEGESMQQLIDLAIQQAASRRQAKVDFLSRAKAAGERARLYGEYRDSETVLGELASTLRAEEAARNRP